MKISSTNELIHSNKISYWHGLVGVSYLIKNVIAPKKAIEIKINQCSILLGGKTPMQDNVTPAIRAVLPSIEKGFPQSQIKAKFIKVSNARKLEAIFQSVLFGALKNGTFVSSFNDQFLAQCRSTVLIESLCMLKIKFNI